MEDITFIKDGIYLKTKNGLEEAILYMNYDECRCFDIETSISICLKKDWPRIQELSRQRGDIDLEEHQIEPVLHNIEYLEVMAQWGE